MHETIIKRCSKVRAALASPVGEVAKIYLIFDGGVYGGYGFILRPKTPQSACSADSSPTGEPFAWYIVGAINDNLRIYIGLSERVWYNRVIRK